jgi:tRNA (cytidine56-2'-O)-methyltransferase
VIAILRIGHRPERDKRITTHVCLVARAFGADTIYITTSDTHLESSVNGIIERFGGSFLIKSGIKPKSIINSWNGTIVHLTMYGEQLSKVAEIIPQKKDLLIIVGAEKVPRYYYQIADYNISIGNQPHSEVAALAILLDRYTEGAWVEKDFHGDITIVPSNRGKKVTAHDSEAIE